MVKCKNEKCPIRERCARYKNKAMSVAQEYNTFEYTEVKNPDGVVVGYVCQFQKPI